MRAAAGKNRNIQKYDTERAARRHAAQQHGEGTPGQWARKKSTIGCTIDERLGGSEGPSVTITGAQVIFFPLYSAPTSRRLMPKRNTE